MSTYNRTKRPPRNVGPRFWPGTASAPGACFDCGQPIVRGDSIYMDRRRTFGAPKRYCTSCAQKLDLGELMQGRPALTATPIQRPDLPCFYCQRPSGACNTAPCDGWRLARWAS